jgi:hypothetical protein
MKFQFATLCVASTLVNIALSLSFDTSSVDGNSVVDLKFVNRIYVPYGPDLTTDPPQASDGTLWEGYGYGTAAAEHFAYDPKEGYVYLQGEIGVSRLGQIGCCNCHGEFMLNHSFSALHYHC